MSDKDYSVGAIMSVPTAGALNKKPIYLITLDDPSGKKSSTQRFLSIDKPDSQNGFLIAKGIFSDLQEDELNKKFSEVLTSTPKEHILEIWLPWHRVISVRNLIFNANKFATLSK